MFVTPLHLQASHSIMRMLKGPKATDFQLHLESYACEGKSCTSVAKLYILLGL